MSISTDAKQPTHGKRGIVKILFGGIRAYTASWTCWLPNEEQRYRIGHVDTYTESPKRHLLDNRWKGMSIVCVYVSVND